MPSKGSSKSGRRISRKQLQFLEYLVWKSKDADDFTKKCLIFLIRRSRGLTKPVGIIFSDRELAGKVSRNLHDMCSCNCTTHIDALFSLTGTTRLDVDYGGIAIRDPLTKWTSILRLRPSVKKISAIIPVDPYKS